MEQAIQSHSFLKIFTIEDKINVSHWEIIQIRTGHREISGEKNKAKWVAESIGLKARQRRDNGCNIYRQKPLNQARWTVIIARYFRRQEEKEAEITGVSLSHTQTSKRSSSGRPGIELWWKWHCCLRDASSFPGLRRREQTHEEGQLEPTRSASAGAPVLESQPLRTWPANYNQEKKEILTLTRPCTAE